MIKKSLTLMGQKIETEMKDELFLENSAMGQTIFHENKVQIQKKSAGIKIAKHQQQQTWCHEMVHMWFYLLNEADLNQNEKLVDQIGSMLFQTLQHYDKTS